jgi:hypothetical protein
MDAGQYKDTVTAYYEQGVADERARVLTLLEGLRAEYPSNNPTWYALNAAHRLAASPGVSP